MMVMWCPVMYPSFLSRGFALLVARSRTQFYRLQWRATHCFAGATMLESFCAVTYDHCISYVVETQSWYRGTSRLNVRDFHWGGVAVLCPAITVTSVINGSSDLLAHTFPCQQSQGMTRCCLFVKYLSRGFLMSGLLKATQALRRYAKQGR